MKCNDLSIRYSCGGILHGIKTFRSKTYSQLSYSMSSRDCSIEVPDDRLYLQRKKEVFAGEEFYPSVSESSQLENYGREKL